MWYLEFFLTKEEREFLQVYVIGPQDPKTFEVDLSLSGDGRRL